MMVRGDAGCVRTERRPRADGGRRTRRQLLRRIGTLGLGLIGLALVEAGPASIARARSQDWETTGPLGPTRQLITPTSGSLYAQTDAGLQRSDDGGVRWRPVSLPANTTLTTVDPIDHDVLYAANDEGLHKSANGGADWAPILARTNEGPSGTTTWAKVANMTVSPADHARLYLATQIDAFRRQWFRSYDGGSSWDIGPTTTITASVACTLPLLLGHAADPNLLLRGGGCTKSAIEPVSIARSDDFGATWRGLTDLTDPTHVVGWRDVNPARLYLAANTHKYVGPGTQTRFEGSALHRSDDDGQTWVQVLNLVGAGAPDSEHVRRIRAISYDPAQPDVVYAAVDTVAVSRDAGQTWNPLGQGLAPINDLALGIDGQNLYAATEAGVFRLRLAAALQQ